MSLAPRWEAWRPIRPNGKTFVLDTNVLLADVRALSSFDDNDVVLSLSVLEELDNNKKRLDEVGRNARAVCRQLDEMRSAASLHDWVPLGKGRLRVACAPSDVHDLLPPELFHDKNDNLIIGLALSLKAGGLDPILVSRDVNVRVKCDVLGLRAQDYLRQRAAQTADQLYTGVLSTDDVDDELVARLWAQREVDALELPPTFQNQIVVVPRGDRERSTCARRVGDKVRLLREHRSVFGLTPRNKEQQFALELLMDENVKLVTLTGSAGCGKTIISLAAGLQQTLEPGHARYERLVVTRPIEPLGRDIGYLPGSMQEKMAPWIAPIRDNLDFLIGSKNESRRGGQRNERSDPYVDMLFQNGKIEIEAVTYIRGRSIANAFILIDEAQNLSVHQLKTIITRSGENSKIVLCGDIEQIDNPHMDATSNGLSCVVEAFKEDVLSGHVALQKGERSALATRAANLL